MSQILAIVDYEAGNLTSVYNALTYLGFPAVITRDTREILRADRVIFPGVGAAKSAMEHLRQYGLDRAIAAAVEQKKPVLGICLGCQIILDHSEEDGGVECLRILPGSVVRFRAESGIKIPHMGWNQVFYANPVRPHPLYAGIPDGSEFYFVHSYYPVVQQDDAAFSYTTYGTQRFVSSLGRGNLFAAQFHIEKSGDVGLQMLRNFCVWNGLC